MRVAVRAASFILGLAYLGLCGAVRSIGSWSDGSGSAGTNPLAAMWALCPLVYFALCFSTSFAKHRSRFVLAAGILAHVILAAFVTVIFFVGTTGVLFLIGSLLASASRWSTSRLRKSASLG